MDNIKIEIPFFDIMASLKVILEQNCIIISHLKNTKIEDERQKAIGSVATISKSLEEYWKARNQSPKEGIS